MNSHDQVRIVSSVNQTKCKSKQLLNLGKLYASWLDIDQRNQISQSIKQNSSIQSNSLSILELLKMFKEKNQKLKISLLYKE